MGRRVPVADKAIAEAALAAIETEYDQACEAAGGNSLTFGEFLLEWASKVKFQPSTRQLVITLDLGMGDAGDPPLSSQPD